MIKRERLEQNRLERGLNSGFANKDKISVKTDLSSKDTVLQVKHVKQSSNAKKTIAHRIETQFNELAKKIDKKPNGFVARMKCK